MSKAIIQEIAENTGSTIYEGYSGRGMFGAECLGIVTNCPTTVITRSLDKGLKGAKQDALGKQHIVYWPRIKN